MNVVIFSSACRATDEERLRSSPSPSPSKTITSIWPPAFRYWRTNSSRSGRGCASSYVRARHNTGGVAVRSPRAKMRAGAPSAMASSVRQYWSGEGLARRVTVQAIAPDPGSAVQLDHDRERSAAAWLEEARQQRFVPMSEIFHIRDIDVIRHLRACCHASLPFLVR